MLVKTTAIILKTTKFGDSSKIISAFTRDYGKLSLIAKGSRNPKSKFGSALEPLSWVEITFYKKSNTDLQLLASADLVQAFSKITSSLEHLASALILAESIYLTHSENHPNQELFDYSTEIFKSLNQKPANPFSLFVASQFKLAETLGFYLHFDFMIEDDLRVQNKFYFSLEDGSPAGFSSQQKNVFVFTRKSAVIMQSIFKLKIDDIIQIEIDDESKKEILRFLSDYFSFHLERNFFYKSYSLILE